ncbi:MAG: hypothetical protein A2Y71_09030 [Bacteroidetes bacterium RBG_13_42_15]|nr:MAG: hypothetical protein A2Y71_09030 [Bacteroidetes bacterium RBG_13_42_15]
MAQVKQNIILKGLSGRVGKNIVFKNYGNKTIVTAYPDMSKVKFSAKQKEENKRFREAMSYARAQMADPDSKAAYKARIKGLQKPHNIAIADFYNPPEIGHVDVSISKASQADRIFIEASDDFMVVRVEVKITNKDGSQKETGQAQQIKEGRWLYVVHEIYPSVEGLTITVRVWDKPGNCTVKVLES